MASLMEAMDGLSRGVRQGDMIRQSQADAQTREGLAEADAAYGNVHKQSQDEWARAGGQGTYKPNDATQFQAAEARGAALAKKGMWKQYLENEGLVAQQRIRVRGEALQQYEQDGDPNALVQRIYPTIFNGKKVVGTEKIGGVPASNGEGAIPASDEKPEQIKVMFDDGTSETKPIAELVTNLKKTLIDPAAFAASEVKANFARQIEESKIGGRLAVEEKKGDNAIKKEQIKSGTSLDVAKIRLGGVQDTNASRERVGAGHDAARIGAASIGATSREKVGAGNNAATIAAAEKGAASREAVATTKAAPKPGNEAKDFNTMHNEVRKMVGEPSQGIMGGSKMANEETLKITRLAEKAMKEGGVPYSAAMQGAIDAYKKRKAAEKSKK